MLNLPLNCSTSLYLSFPIWKVHQGMPTLCASVVIKYFTNMTYILQMWLIVGAHKSQNSPSQKSSYQWPIVSVNI